MRWDAVVVGAGPAGAATALRLARAGASVLLLDRARFPRHKPCSEYLSPGTTAVLERLGSDVLGAVERAPHAKVYGMQVVAPGGAAMCGRFGTAYSFALPRATFDTILVRAAEQAGAVVREGRRSKACSSTAVRSPEWSPARDAGCGMRIALASSSELMASVPSSRGGSAPYGRRHPTASPLRRTAPTWPASTG